MYNTAIFRLLQQLPGSSGPAALTISVSDSTTTSEKIDAIRNNARDISVTDTMSTSESVSVQIQTSINISDTISTSESITILPIGIYLDATSTSGYKVSLSTYSWSHTTTGINRGLVVNVSIFATGTVSSITYNSIAMQFIRFDSIGIYRNEIWVLGNPTVGTNTIIVTLNTSLTSIADAVSYTGVDVGEMVEANTGATGSGISSPSKTITTLSDQSWVIDGLTTSDATMSVTGAQTQRVNQTGTLGTGAMGDIGPVTPIGSATPSWSAVGALDSWAISVLALDPANEAFTASISVSDTTTTSESVSELDLEFINVSDMTVTSEALEIIRNNSRDFNVTDSATISESIIITIISPDNVNVLDMTSISELIDVEIQTNVSVSDLSTTSEILGILIPVLFISTSDIIITSEILTTNLVDLINVSDMTSMSEHIVVTLPGAALSINVSDTISGGRGRSANIIILTDGRLALRLANNLYHPL